MAVSSRFTTSGFRGKFNVQVEHTAMWVEGDVFFSKGKKYYNRGQM